MLPTIGRIVIYRSRTGDYDVPAIINCTADTINPKGVEAYATSFGARGVPPLTQPENVHLTVLTPGKPGQRANADDFKVESEHGVSENVAGCYQEWDVPFDGGLTKLDVTEITPGSWRWPERVAPAEPAPAPDDDRHALVVFAPLVDSGTHGEIIGVCRTREAAQQLVAQHDHPAEVRTFGYVEDAPKGAQPR